MTVESGAEERAWAAEKRDFVADARDDAADARDETADRRDALAEVREAQLDEWEALLAARAQELGLAVEGTPGAAERGQAGAGGLRGSAERAAGGRQRQEEQADRDAASKLRVAEARPTLLALAFAEIAEQLYDADTYEEVLTRIAEAAVAVVAGGHAASVTVVQEGTYQTVGATDQAAWTVDQGQYEVGEGPSVDAFTMPLVDAPAFPDVRWPLLGARPTESGVESSLSYRLNAGDHERADAAGTGSLNIYALTPEAFDQAAREIGFILAVHASLAARAVGERATLEGVGRNLQQALLSRDVIGQAKGILMERLKTTPDNAFEILKRSSQRLNVKLREVAGRLAETGELNNYDPKQP